MFFKNLINISKLFLLVGLFLNVNLTVEQGIDNKLAQTNNNEDTLVIIEWNKTYGGIEDDEPRVIIQTSDGGYLILGQTRSFGVSQWSTWLIKLDQSGNVIWDQIFEGIRGSEPYSIIETNDGYLLVGVFNCCWAIKTDFNGIQQWNKSETIFPEYSYFNGTHTIKNKLRYHSVIYTKDGGFLFFGAFVSLIFLPNVSIRIGSNYNSWMSKLDSSGNQVWNKTFGGPERNGFVNAIELKNGGYLLAGGTSSINASSSWLLKTDSEGNEIWKRVVDESSSIDQFPPIYINSIAETMDRGYVVSASTTLSLIDFEHNRVLCLIKYDFLGNKLWDQCFPSSGSFSFTSAIEKPNGGYLLGGSSNLSSLENKTDMWIISTDKAGQVGWDINLGGLGTQILYSMINSINGGYLVLGLATSEFDGVDRDRDRNSDIYLFKIFVDESSDATVSGLLIAPLFVAFILIWIRKRRKK